jgi:intracellular septation protein A
VRRVLSADPGAGSPRPVLGQGLRPRQVVLGHVLPRIAEAVVIPSALFYIAWNTLGLGVALSTALVWAAAVITRRFVRTGQVPALVVLGAVGLCARTLVTVATGSTFVYFLQPILVTACVSASFFASVAVGRPIVRTLAAEFCPLSPEVSSRHTVQRLFRSLTLLWAGVLLAQATVTLVILLVLSTDSFVNTKSVLTPAVMITATAVTVVWAVRVARREGLDMGGVGAGREAAA